MHPHAIHIRGVSPGECQEVVHLLLGTVSGLKDTKAFHTTAFHSLRASVSDSALLCKLKKGQGTLASMGQSVGALSSTP